MQTVDIYIDTSVKGPKRRDGSYIHVVAMQTSKGPADVWWWEPLKQTTENQATLLALEAALKRLTKPCNLIIHLECTYVASALKNGWYIKWRHQGWMTEKNKLVCDSEIWQSIEYLLNTHEFQVRLKEPHTYREWMQRKLNERESVYDGAKENTTAP